MIYDSQWADTLTFFPLLSDYLLSKRADLQEKGRALMIGAADGKFVFPLLNHVKHVTAVEQDTEPLNQPSTGLRSQVSNRGVEKRIDIRQVNFSDYESENDAFDIVFTSCSWHYSLNEGRIDPTTFIEKMKLHLGDRGVFCAEYMMPNELWHHGCARYLREGQVAQHFEGWRIIYNIYTDVFDEAPHPGKEQWHQHKMGFFLATKQD